MKLENHYRSQLYWFLRDDYDGNNQPIPRNKERDVTAINCYKREMKKMGLDPKIEELLEEVQHDNDAVLLRFEGIRSLFSIFYKDFKPITHVINNKENYIGKKVDLTEINIESDVVSDYPLDNFEGLVVGIGKNSIVLKDSELKKHFYWYLGVPIKYCGRNTKSHGGEIAKYLIEKYGE